MIRQKMPNVVCPACLELHRRLASDDWVVICRIIYDQYEAGQSNYPNYTIVPDHCEQYERCDLWREEKEKDWKRKYGAKYSSVEQGEEIRL